MDSIKNEKKPSIIKNYLYNLSYKLLAILVPLITTPYISRVLMAESIGAISYTQSIATYFSIFGIMGFNLYGQLQISKVRDDKKCMSQVFSEIFAAKIVTSILSYAIFIAFVAIYGMYVSLLYIMGIMIIANAVDISWLFQGIEEFKKIVIRNYIIKLLGLLLIISFVKSEDDVLLYAIIIQGSALLGNLALWFRIRSYINLMRFDVSTVIKHVKSCAVYFLPTIATTIYTSTDKVMLGAIAKSDYQNGIYDQAHKIEQLIITIISSMSTVLLPRLSYLHSNKDREKLNDYILKAISITGLVAIPITCGLYGVADVFIPVFLGSKFYDCIPLIRVFSILIMFSGINTMLGDSCLVAQGKQGKYNIGVFAGATINVVLNAIAIPLLSSMGAALASLVSEMTVFGFFLYYSKNSYISLINIIKKWIKYFFAAVPMGIIVWIVGWILGVGIFTLFIQIILGCILYVLFLYISRDVFFASVLKKMTKK